METFIIGLLIGMVSGMLIIATISYNRINESDSLARARGRSLRKAERKVVEQNNYIKNLENNLEFVTNNLSVQKKKLVGLSDQD